MRGTPPGRRPRRSAAAMRALASEPFACQCHVEDPSDSEPARPTCDHSPPQWLRAAGVAMGAGSASHRSRLPAMAAASPSPCGAKARRPGAALRLQPTQLRRICGISGCMEREPGECASGCRAPDTLLNDVALLSALRDPLPAPHLSHLLSPSVAVQWCGAALAAEAYNRMVHELPEVPAAHGTDDGRGRLAARAHRIAMSAVKTLPIMSQLRALGDMPPKEVLTHRPCSSATRLVGCGSPPRACIAPPTGARRPTCRPMGTW